MRPIIIIGSYDRVLDLDQVLPKLRSGSCFKFVTLVFQKLDEEILVLAVGDMSMTHQDIEQIAEFKLKPCFDLVSLEPAGGLISIKNGKLSFSGSKQIKRFNSDLLRQVDPKQLSDIFGAETVNF